MIDGQRVLPSLTALFYQTKKKSNRIVNTKEHLKTQHSFLGMYQTTRGCSGGNFVSSQKQVELQKTKRNKKVSF